MAEPSISFSRSFVLPSIAPVPGYSTLEETTGTSLPAEQEISSCYTCTFFEVCDGTLRTKSTTDFGQMRRSSLFFCFLLPTAKPYNAPGQTTAPPHAQLSRTSTLGIKNSEQRRQHHNNRTVNGTVNTKKKPSSMDAPSPPSLPHFPFGLHGCNITCECSSSAFTERRLSSSVSVHALRSPISCRTASHGSFRRKEAEKQTFRGTRTEPTTPGGRGHSQNVIGCLLSLVVAAFSTNSETRGGGGVVTSPFFSIRYRQRLGYVLCLAFVIVVPCMISCSRSASCGHRCRKQ